MDRSPIVYRRNGTKPSSKLVPHYFRAAAGADPAVRRTDGGVVANYVYNALLR
jgi:hypothetical protein